MSSVREDFDQYADFETPGDVILADKSKILAVGSGDVNVVIFDDDTEVPVVFKNVLFVPRLKKRLISISQITKSGATVIFKGDLCTLIIDEVKYGLGHKHGKLWKLNNAATCCFGCTDLNSLSIWHLRFGHLNKKDVKLLASEKLVDGIAVDPKAADEVCEGCILGKQTRYPFPKTGSTKSTDVLHLVHSDVCGPLSVVSVGGSIYYVTFIDDFSNFVWVYMLKLKSEVLEKFVEFVAMVETFTGKKLKRLRSDNGGEYFGDAFNDFCKERGIMREPTIPYTPQQNGKAERLNRTIMDNVRAMLHHANLPLNLWAEAVATVVYLRNLSPTSSFQGATPYERWHGAKPNVEHLRTFGCTVYVHVPDVKRKKLEAKSTKGVFIGYPEGRKGYKVYFPETRKMSYSRDVKFLETSFRNKVVSEENSTQLKVIGCAERNPSQRVNVDEEFNVSPSSRIYSSSDDEDDEEDNLARTRNVLDFSKRPIRNRRAPDPYGEWATVADVQSEPKTYKQALKHPNAEQWKDAMKEEYSALMKHHTWDLVDLPEGRNLVGCKWVYKAKQNADGDIDRYKSRLVAQGYSQEAGVDYDEVFAPVAQYKSIRTVLAISNQFDLEIHQMDVKSAFLNGELSDEIYMKQPEGFVDPNHPNKVCRLNRSLYGLKQSARCWNMMIHEYLKSANYVQSSADPCVYYRCEEINGKKKVIVLFAVYVDDTIICSNSIAVLIEEKKRLSGRFEMDDRGELHYILGMEVTRDRKNRIMTINQKNYLENVLKRFNMDNCKSVSTPMEASVSFSKLTESEEPVDVTLYQAAVGSLNYAAIATRPDLSTVVGKLSQFMQKPGKDHWVAVKRALRYVQGTLDFGLKFESSDSFVLHGFADADWAGCAESRRSTSGYVFKIGNATVSWSSKKQAVVALSSTEAEYISLCRATQESVWLRNLLRDVGFKQLEPTCIREDNQGAMCLARNPKDHPRTKHIDIKYHYTREKIEQKVIRLEYVPTSEMLADTLTKGLSKPKFEKFREAMGIESCHHSR